MKTAKPPFKITEEALSLSLDIASLLGRIEGFEIRNTVSPQLRKQNKIKTVQSSLAIEGNTLSLEQVTDILDGRRVKGDPKEILEVKNTIALYEESLNFSPSSLRDFKKSHKILMNRLLKDAGKFRSKNVGIVKGAKVKHIAPKPNFVPKLIEDLFHFIKDDATPLLIKSAVVHYEIEFIHPFTDGNGRIGRFWQHLILVQYNPIFTQIPFESVIKEQQKAYYKVLELCDKLGDSTQFIIFSLKTLKTALMRFEKESTYQTFHPQDRLELARTHFLKHYFSRKDYFTFCKTISTATASRDLKFGVEQKLLEKKGEHSRTLYRFKI